MANSITITGGKGDFRLKSYIPEAYSPKLREKFWYNTILRKITNTEFKGQFKNHGDTVVVRCMPNIATTKFVDGGKIEYQKPEAYDVKYTIDRGRMYAFQVSDVQKAFSDIPNWAEKWTDDGAKQLAEDEEREFFADMTSALKCDPANTGTTAGRISKGYNLGSSTSRVKIGGTDGTKPLDLITCMAAALDEQPGGAGATPFVVIPVWFAQRLQTDETFHSANKMGDDVSILRKNAVSSIGKVAGMDVYVSNLLPQDGANCALLFGDSSAITFADEVSSTEVLRDKDAVADFHRSYHIYDWFVRYPERFGVSFVERG